MSEWVVEEVTYTPQPQLSPGELVDGRYRIDEYLGGGGMATVYRATHLALAQPVAIKTIAPSVRMLPGIAERFLREARAATRLKGEHVVRVFDVGTMADGTPFMVMELLEGDDLGALIAAGTAISIERACDFVLETCEALAEVHGLGIIHRDVKPANLFLTRGPDGRSSIKLIDFGVSHVDAPLSSPAPGLTRPEMIVGSPQYMSPEQMHAASKIDGRSDLWSLGAVLYELLTGDPPYGNEGFWSVCLAAAHGPPPAPSTRRRGVPAGLDNVVLRCLRFEPEDRFADAAALAVALAPFASPGGAERARSTARVLEAAKARGRGEPVVERSLERELATVPSRLAERPRRRRRTRIGIAVAVGIAAITSGAVALGGHRFVGGLHTLAKTAPPPTVSPSPTFAAEAPEPAAAAISVVTPATAPAPPPEPTITRGARAKFDRRIAPARHAPRTAPVPTAEATPADIELTEPSAPDEAAAPGSDEQTLFEDRQ
ncbi:serine/threonine protein kinase [Labilithrix luteola]|uniref:Serine/threonine protein kinase n=1 Tax=Labilithrix luteola TaxID=1391654 RepID=A0A0K1QAT8_9BACT|nr:serine/threonine-protein kinase [Labilithrix luteola]AKV02848.1 serine/threonine protein kinase [Labilithrix luteola]